MSPNRLKKTYLNNAVKWLHQLLTTS